jgi:hypothetical protein
MTRKDVVNIKVYSTVIETRGGTQLPHMKYQGDFRACPGAIGPAIQGLLFTNMPTTTSAIRNTRVAQKQVLLKPAETRPRNSELAPESVHGKENCSV